MSWRFIEQRVLDRVAVHSSKGRNRVILEPSPAPSLIGRGVLSHSTCLIRFAASNCLRYGRPELQAAGRLGAHRRKVLLGRHFGAFPQTGTAIDPLRLPFL